MPDRATAARRRRPPAPRRSTAVLAQIPDDRWTEPTVTARRVDADRAARAHGGLARRVRAVLDAMGAGTWDPAAEPEETPSVAAMNAEQAERAAALTRSGAEEAVAAARDAGPSRVDGAARAHARRMELVRGVRARTTTRSTCTTSPPGSPAPPRTRRSAGCCRPTPRPGSRSRGCSRRSIRRSATPRAGRRPIVCHPRGRVDATAAADVVEHNAGWGPPSRPTSTCDSSQRRVPRELARDRLRPGASALEEARARLRAALTALAASVGGPKRRSSTSPPSITTRSTCRCFGASPVPTDPCPRLRTDGNTPGRDGRHLRSHPRRPPRDGRRSAAPVRVGRGRLRAHGPALDEGARGRRIRRGPLHDDRDRDRAGAAVPRLAHRGRSRRSDLHRRHAARAARRGPGRRTCPSSPAPTRCSRSCDGRSPRPCSTSPTSSRRRDPATTSNPSTRSPDVSVMQIPALAISSTDIRARVHEGRPIRFLVPGGVEAYIRRTRGSTDERRELRPSRADALQRRSSGDWRIQGAMASSWCCAVCSVAVVVARSGDDEHAARRRRRATTSPAASAGPERPAGLLGHRRAERTAATIGSGGGRVDAPSCSRPTSRSPCRARAR